MAMEVKKYQVNCPFSNRPEFVYVYVLNDAAAFNGCDNNYHGCPECNELCKAKALQLLDQERREGPPPHLHSPV
jgi:hypothetical protein